jgi:glycosidase
MRARIYQLPLRQFSNVGSPRRVNGSMAVNGVGRFADIGERALGSLREMGFTHVWLMGVLRQATGTDWSSVGLPADPPELLKGIAGSPYAVRDCFDVCPDYAIDPARRREEFLALVERFHRAGLRVWIDFVPNHVARSHRTVVRPDLEFGVTDDPSKFFAPDNHFFHLVGQGPLRLPERVLGKGRRFLGESGQARVTGNNGLSAAPGVHDWFETVKLNYGWDFTQGPGAGQAYPTHEHPQRPIPSLWHRMDAVLAHWQTMGVDGFRCDMAHMIPMEFWAWAIARARGRVRGTEFMAEAYADDPARSVDGDVLAALVEAGFDLVYDHAAYGLVKGIFEGPKWANDLDGVLGHPQASHRVRYVENHDEVRVAHPQHWGGYGAWAGLAVAAVLWGTGPGAALVYAGQEVGEPALDVEGFGGGNGRTSLFDYGAMPELAKWANGHAWDGGGLSEDQRGLRAAYARLLRLMEHPVQRAGRCVPLNPVNLWNPGFGRAEGEAASGHWLYAWARVSSEGSLVWVVNLGRELRRGVRVLLSEEVRSAIRSRDPSRVFEEYWRGSPVAVDAVTADSVWLGDLEPFGIRVYSIPSKDK